MKITHTSLIILGVYILIGMWFNFLANNTYLKIGASIFIITMIITFTGIDYHYEIKNWKIVKVK